MNTAKCVDCENEVQVKHRLNEVFGAGRYEENICTECVFYYWNRELKNKQGGV